MASREGPELKAAKVSVDAEGDRQLTVSVLAGEEVGMADRAAGADREVKAHREAMEVMEVPWCFAWPWPVLQMRSTSPVREVNPDLAARVAQADVVVLEVEVAVARPSAAADMAGRVGMPALKVRRDRPDLLGRQVK